MALGQQLGYPCFILPGKDKDDKYGMFAFPNTEEFLEFHERWENGFYKN